VAGTSDGGDTEAVVTCAGGAAQLAPNAAQARTAHRLIAPPASPEAAMWTAVAELAKLSAQTLISYLKWHT
jgi:hypothetical protein